MKASNIFKMEMYKNFRDKPWLIIIASLAGFELLATILGIVLIKSTSTTTSSPGALFIALSVMLIVFGVIGFYVFIIAYPFHLLSIDYSNKTLGLMIASGVKRTNYYFVKILATLLSNLMALFTICIIPLVLIMGIFNAEFIQFMQMLSETFNSNEAWLFILSMILSNLLSIFVLAFAVILTRGKFWGIFVYFGFSMAVGLISTLITTSILAISVNNNSNFEGFSPFGSGVPSMIISILGMVLFMFLGLLMIKKQDL